MTEKYFSKLNTIVGCATSLDHKVLSNDPSTYIIDIEEPTEEYFGEFL
jgi:hypothetical protein